MGTRTNGRQILLTIGHRSFLCCFSLLWACTAAFPGCAASSQGHPVASAHDDQSRDNVLSLKYLCDTRVRRTDELGIRVAQSIRDALSNDGFQLVQRADVPHDAILRIHVSAQRVQSLFKVYVNGRPRLSYQVSADISVETTDSVLDHVETQFTTSEEIPTENIDALVTSIGRSRRVATLATGKAKTLAEASAAAKVKVAQEAKRQIEQQKAEEESTWKDADPNGCSNPATLQACIGVRLYLSKFPEGSHADEARRVVVVAQPGLDLLQKDDNYWITESNYRGCTEKHNPTACEGVELYAAKFPSGLHHVDAAELLQASGLR